MPPLPFRPPTPRTRTFRSLAGSQNLPPTHTPHHLHPNPLAHFPLPHLRVPVAATKIADPCDGSGSAACPAQVGAGEAASSATVARF